MKKHFYRSRLYLTLFFTCISITTFSAAFAQNMKYKPGDRVEVMFSGKWQPGTVMPLAKNDLNRTGSKHRVKIDSLPDYLQPEGTEIMTEDMRPGSAPAVANNDEGKAQDHHGQQGGRGSTFRPGERVQAFFGGKWQSGTVMPLLKNDLNQTGSKLRIKLDSMADYLQPDGTEIMAEDVRPGVGQPQAETAPVSNNHARVPGGHPAQHEAQQHNAQQQGAFKPGDRVEAIWNGRKVTGTVIPLLANDLNKSGTKIRVKIDGLADYLQPEGTEIMTVDVKHSNAAPNNDKFENGLPAAWNPGKAPLALGGAVPEKQPGGAPAGEYVGKRGAESPKMIGNVPDLRGTAWKMLFDRAVHVVPVIYFRKTGRYETLQIAAGMQGNYHQNGSSLTMEKDTYTMSFDPATNILRFGDLKLLYDGQTAH